MLSTNHIPWDVTLVAAVVVAFAATNGRLLVEAGVVVTAVVVGVVAVVAADKAELT